jgi:hypothetical protein
VVLIMWVNRELSEVGAEAWMLATVENEWFVDARAGEFNN